MQNWQKVESIVQCIAACTQNAVLAAKENSSKLLHCIELSTQCAIVCNALLQLVIHGSEYCRKQAAVCAELCASCAKECGRHDTDYCRECMLACINCSTACNSLTTA